MKDADLTPIVIRHSQNVNRSEEGLAELHFEKKSGTTSESSDS